MEKHREIWHLLLGKEESSFHQPVFPSADRIHDKFFVIERVDGEVKLCPFDRLGISYVRRLSDGRRVYSSDRKPQIHSICFCRLLHPHPYSV
ncbi:hypothetical protein HDV64DRAFT_255563 [Trichoderma sp. TUCIM 5745]